MTEGLQCGFSLDRMSEIKQEREDISGQQRRKPAVCYSGGGGGDPTVNMGCCRIQRCEVRARQAGISDQCKCEGQDGNEGCDNRLCPLLVLSHLAASPWPNSDLELVHPVMMDLLQRAAWGGPGP